MSSYITPFDFGAVGDGVADDTLAVQQALSNGSPLDWQDGHYRITSPLSAAAVRQVRWKSCGAEIVLDAAVAVKSALTIDAAGHDMSVDGTFTIDADRNAYSGIMVDNAGAFARFYADDLRTRNHYRSGTAFSGGDGIWISGAWTKVELKADVRDGAMAIGAGISGSQGVFGVTIARTAAGAPQVVNADLYVENIQSEDPAYTADQDGCRVFGAAADPARVFPWYSHAKIGGTFKNCAGRSIKSQMHETIIDGVAFIRESAVLGSNSLGNEEVEFQYGGGVLTNFACFYYSARPDCVVSSAGIQTPDGIVPAGPLVSKGHIYMRGSALDALARLKIYDASVARVTVRDVVAVSELNAIKNIVAVWNGANNGQRVFVELDGVTAPVWPTSSLATSAWVTCSGSTAVPIHVQATGLCNTLGNSGTRPLTYPASQANITKSLYGNNYGVNL